MNRPELIDHTYEDIEVHIRVKPHYSADHGVYQVDYEVRKLTYWDGLKFEKAGDSEEYATSNIDESAVWIRGHIKWDGCSDNNFLDGGNFHACSPASVIRLGAVFERLFSQAGKLLNNAHSGVKWPQVRSFYDQTTQAHAGTYPSLHEVGGHDLELVMRELLTSFVRDGEDPFISKRRVLCLFDAFLASIRPTLLGLNDPALLDQLDHRAFTVSTLLKTGLCGTVPDFPAMEVYAPQSRGDVREVVEEAVRALQTEGSAERFYEILIQSAFNASDAILQGYAIFPGSAGRRELFNWWLDSLNSAYVLNVVTSFISKE